MLLFSNNARKMHGLPLHRKKIKERDFIQGVRQRKILMQFTIGFGGKTEKSKKEEPLEETMRKVVIQWTS